MQNPRLRIIWPALHSRDNVSFDLLWIPFLRMLLVERESIFLKRNSLRNSVQNLLLLYRIWNIHLVPSFWQHAHLDFPSLTPSPPARSGAQSLPNPETNLLQHESVSPQWGWCLLTFGDTCLHRRSWVQEVVSKSYKLEFHFLPFLSFSPSTLMYHSQITRSLSSPLLDEGVISLC